MEGGRLESETDAELLVLEMEEEVKSQGIGMPPFRDSLLQPPEGRKPCR
jgi:hypothetical protein